MMQRTTFWGGKIAVRPGRQ